MILTFFHGYAWRRLSLLISWNSCRSPRLLFSAIAPWFLYQIRQVWRSKCAQRNVLAYAANCRYLALLVSSTGCIIISTLKSLYDGFTYMLRKKTHLTLRKLETKKSKAHASTSRYSFSKRIFWAQAQLTSSIRSEVMKDKLRHIKITSNVK